MNCVKKFIAMLLMVTLVVTLVACGSSGNKTTETTTGNGTAVESTGTTASEKGSYAEFPQFNLTNKKVKLMANWMKVDEIYAQSLKDAYGLEIELIKCGWTDIPTKLSTFVMSQQSPDMVLIRPDLDDYPKFIVNELVQPIDKYIDLNHPLYADVKEAYSKTEWDGKHYMLLETIYNGVALYYNKSLLKDHGLDLPWDLYKQGKWDWNAFRNLALELKTESEDGTIGLYGFAMQLPFPLVYTAGKPFGYIDSNEKTIENNIKDPDIARAANFLSDMVVKDKVAPASIDGALGLFKNEQTAMLIAGTIYQMPEVVELAKAGKLGIAPIPKDPQADAHYVRGTLGGWFIPVGAPNPEGAAAASAVRIHMLKDEARKKEISAKMKVEYGLSDENIEQFNMADTDGVKKVLETTAWIGYDSVWLMVGNTVNWETQVATDLPLINARIAEMFKKNK